MSGCLSLNDTPTASPAEPDQTPPPGPTVAPRAAGELIIGVPADPQTFVPPADDETGALLGDLIYDPLYRLDSSLTPQPALAAAAPQVSADGLTWTIPMRSGERFDDGSPIHASDAVFSLELAASPNCPFGQDVCDAVASHFASAADSDASTLVITLVDAWSPFLATVLGRLPILSESAVDAATAQLSTHAAQLDASAIQDRVGQIADDTNADRCLVTSPPTGCHLGDYATELAAVLRSAGVTPPPDARFADGSGAVDPEARGAALLADVGSLATALQASGIDRSAAAVPLFDIVADPIGGGPFRVAAYTPGVSVELARNDDHQPVATLKAIRLRIIGDPTVAATALRAHDVDWLLDVQADGATDLAGAIGITVAAHPDPVVRSIVFNVRSGRVYEDPVARQAFSLCIDRAGLAATASGGVGVPASFETAARSWALASAPAPVPANAGAAESALEADGWQRGADGIYARNGIRLSSTIDVRATRTDLYAFAQAASAQLNACGIELDVVDQDTSGDQLLTELQWPNDFETALIARTLDVDPDSDFQAFDSGHATSAADPGDANPGGFTSTTVDGLLAQARASADLTARAATYAQVEAALAETPPSYPIWYDLGYSAIAASVHDATGAVDLTAPRYWWDAWTWQLAP